MYLLDQLTDRDLELLEMLEIEIEDKEYEGEEVADINNMISTALEDFYTDDEELTREFEALVDKFMDLEYEAFTY